MLSRSLRPDPFRSFRIDLLCCKRAAKALCSHTSCAPRYPGWRPIVSSVFSGLLPARLREYQRVVWPSGLGVWSKADDIQGAGRAVRPAGVLDRSERCGAVTDVGVEGDAVERADVRRFVVEEHRACASGGRGGSGIGGGGG